MEKQTTDPRVQVVAKFVVEKFFVVGQGEGRMRLKRLALISAASVFSILLGGASHAGAQDDQSPQVETMDKTPVFRTEVISRTTKAVDYRHRGGSTEVDLKGTDLMPRANGEAKVDSKAGRLEIKIKLSGMERADKFGLEYLTYVLWAITPQGRASNLAEVVLDNGKSDIHATTDLQAFGLIITAEPYFAVTQPSDLVVAQNIIRPDTKGREEAIDVKFELLPKGLYASHVEPIGDVVYGIDRKAPLDLFEARNAIRIARAARADQYAASIFAKAEADLTQAEEYYRRKQGRTPIGTVARELAFEFFDLYIRLLSTTISDQNLS